MLILTVQGNLFYGLLPFFGEEATGQHHPLGVVPAHAHFTVASTVKVQLSGFYFNYVIDILLDG